MLATVPPAARSVVRRAREISAALGANGALGRRLTALVAALLVLSGAVGAGRTYLWCSMMERAVEACCCEPGRDGDEDRSAPEIGAACCEDHAVGELAKARVAANVIDVPDAVVGAIALPPAAPPPIAAPPLAAPLRASLTRASPIRAGPLRAAETCARLQVFRC